MKEMRRGSFRSFSEILLSFSLRILFLIVLLYMILQGVKLAYRYGHGLVSLEIKEGESSSDVAAQLEKLGLIDNKESFMLKAKLYHASLLPGTYSLNTAMTQVDILDFISEEGKKNQELSDKKLLQEGDTESSLKEEDFSAGNEGD